MQLIWPRVEQALAAEPLYAGLWEGEPGAAEAANAAAEAPLRAGGAGSGGAPAQLYIPGTVLSFRAPPVEGSSAAPPEAAAAAAASGAASARSGGSPSSSAGSIDGRRGPPSPSTPTSLGIGPAASLRERSGGSPRGAAALDSASDRAGGQERPPPLPPPPTPSTLPRCGRCCT